MSVTIATTKQTEIQCNGQYFRQEKCVTGTNEIPSFLDIAFFLLGKDRVDAVLQLILRILLGKRFRGI